MTNRKMVLIFGVTILVLSFMGLILYQMHEQKQVALEQLRILKDKEEARVKQEQERQLAETKRKEAEEARRRAEEAEKQRLAEQSRAEQEEVERFKQGLDSKAREERRRIEEEQTRAREAGRKEGRERAESLKNPIITAEREVDSVKFRLKQLNDWVRIIHSNYETDKIRAEQSSFMKEQTLQGVQRQFDGDSKTAEIQLKEENFKLKQAQDNLDSLKKQYNDLMQ